MHLLYSISLKRTVLITGFFFLLCIVFTKTTHAASLSSASATLTTSRPSASSPINANAAAGVGSLTIFSNGSRYLASDSAQIVRGTGIISNNGLIVASQSAAFTTVYLAGTLGTAAGAGADVLFVPITAMHTIGFTPNTTVPSGGKIVITYPGTFTNSASPSATTFAFNNLTSGNIKSFPATACNSISISSSGTPTITCTTNAVQPAGTNIQIYIGCSAIAGSGGCTTQVPTLINPTKAAAAGTADIWKVGIQTTDASSVTLDNSTVAIGTIESVTVRATIDPSLSFQIIGIASGAVNASNGGCSQTETVNSGIPSTVTEVGLGVLSTVPGGATTQISNEAAQRLVVTTNGANGYSITATSSGSLKMASTGFFLNSSTTPIAFPNAGHFFGFHACGVDTDLLKWNTTGVSDCTTTTGGTNACKYGWPTATSPILIAQDTTGPIGNGVPTGNGIVSMSYAATQDVTLPPGEYQTVVTYVATPSF